MRVFKFLLFSLCLFCFVACEKADKYDFSLNSAQGQVSLKDFKGQKLIVYFGFTFCPDVCPATLALLSKELKNLQNDEVHLLFISLDPLRDNDIKASDEYVRYFYKNSQALIAKDEQTLAKIAKNYNVIYEKVPLKNDYTIAHSNELFCFDEEGKLIKRIKDLSSKNLQKELSSFLGLK